MWEEEMINLQESVQEVVADEISLENQRPRRDVRKIIVAMHGIGDQFTFATIQTVAHRFSDYFRAPEAIPLGKHGALILESPPYGPPPSDPEWKWIEKVRSYIRPVRRGDDRPPAGRQQRSAKDHRIGQRFARAAMLFL
jgi:hypothetical protein